MSEKLIPLSIQYEEWIKPLFHVNGLLYLTKQQYSVYWPLVDGFWTHTNCQKYKHGNSLRRYYSCRLSKPREFSVAEAYPVENPSGKSRITSFFSSNTCSMKIKVTESLLLTKLKSYIIEQVIGRKKEDRLRVWRQKGSPYVMSIVWHRPCLGPRGW